MSNLKFSSLLLAIALLSFTISGCEKKVVDSIPPMYSVNLMFTDQDGKDLLNNVKGVITKSDIAISSSEGEIMTSAFEVHEINNKKYLTIDLSSRTKVYLKQINFSISNKDLMGDAEVHTVNTQWHLELKHNNVVTALQLDGKSAVRNNEPIIHYVLIKAD